MRQIDLDAQVHTNALVLEYLLQPENVAVPAPHRRDIDLSDAERLLTMVTSMTPPVRVILDVGAQILELDNISVARKWLSMLRNDNAIQAAVFVDKEDQICVLDRKGHVALLHASPFATQLGSCVVFLDEAHTRGIDLVLPQYYRAAVTLGANLTKDRLVQACMRMRRLGHGQSVVFCVPSEICSKMNTDNPTVADILLWVIRGTWEDAARSVPLWAAQGRRHGWQRKIWEDAQTEDGAVRMTEAHARRLLEEEAMSIRDRYQPRTAVAPLAEDDPISQRFRVFKRMDQFSAALSEEQERELSPEVERERQIQKAPPAKPAAHCLHPDIIAFVATGLIAANSSAHMPAYTSLSTTAAAQCMDLQKCPRNVYVSRDFAITVEGGGSDCTQRQVQWVLLSMLQSSMGAIDKMIIISPFEAQELLPSIQKSAHAALCLYSPRPNKGYHALDGLDLYTVPEQPALAVPPQLITELTVFAGELYFSSFAECVRVCYYFGINISGIHEQQKECIDANSIFYSPSSCFATSPVKFLQVFLSQVRRGCGGIGKTHMGFILEYRYPKDL
ncbi:hypothetical protein LMH87_001510 [Akanthomyces muscarius]|uniref:ubiquitinyl hydrolase 1 n=1 Tax=Akanthomyces muscarius TaxID=2231603 RepID=A0A9W8Q4G1_AKAMU|nr:hypothetical protein LMH87_001510 [Akanthomyces muscarius]KAJ4146957.1 hypothetical protein LMH87_001510 [Akanthomyces muscarius]